MVNRPNVSCQTRDYDDDEVDSMAVNKGEKFGAQEGQTVGGRGDMDKGDWTRKDAGSLIGWN